MVSLDFCTVSGTNSVSAARVETIFGPIHQHDYVSTYPIGPQHEASQHVILKVNYWGRALNIEVTDKDPQNKLPLRRNENGEKTVFRVGLDKMMDGSFRGGEVEFFGDSVSRYANYADYMIGRIQKALKDQKPITMADRDFRVQIVSEPITQLQAHFHYGTYIMDDEETHNNQGPFFKAFMIPPDQSESLAEFYAINPEY